MYIEFRSKRNRLLLYSARSPIFSHVSDSLQGLTTIRALKVKEIVVDEFNDHQDLHSSAWFLFFSGSRGLGMYLDIFCACFLTSVLLILLAFNRTTLAGDVGLAVTQCLILINTLQWGVRQFAELENQMTSVERVLEYSKLPCEPYIPNVPIQKTKECGIAEDSEESPLTEAKVVAVIPAFWPSEGRIEFRGVTLKYAKQGPAILKGLNLMIKRKEKIGIVGRTGAGKSSLINALFRLAYVDGEILIDDVPTGGLALHDLRSKVIKCTIIFITELQPPL